MAARFFVLGELVITNLSDPSSSEPGRIPAYPPFFWLFDFELRPSNFFLYFPKIKRRGGGRV